MKEEVPIDGAELVDQVLLLTRSLDRSEGLASLSAISCDGRRRAGGGDGELRRVGFGRRGRHLHPELGGVAVPEHRVVSERQEPDLSALAGEDARWGGQSAGGGGVRGAAAVGDELAQEDLLLRVEGVDDDVLGGGARGSGGRRARVARGGAGRGAGAHHQLVHIGLELERFCADGRRSRRGHEEGEEKPSGPHLRPAI